MDAQVYSMFSLKYVPGISPYNTPGHADNACELGTFESGDLSNSSWKCDILQD